MDGWLVGWFVNQVLVGWMDGLLDGWVADCMNRWLVINILCVWVAFKFGNCMAYSDCSFQLPIAEGLSMCSNRTQNLQVFLPLYEKTGYSIHYPRISVSLKFFLLFINLNNPDFNTNCGLHGFLKLISGLHLLESNCKQLNTQLSSKSLAAIKSWK